MCSSQSAALDTIKVRMQLSRRGKSTGQKPRGFFATGAYIVKRETPLGLYKGLGAVVAGIVPKMAIRFMSFEYYKAFFADRETGLTNARGVFLGELRSEAVGTRSSWKHLWGLEQASGAAREPACLERDRTGFSFAVLKGPCAGHALFLFSSC